MELDPLLLSRVQFAFTITFHIIFPSFTIGLAAWLATIEGLSILTARPVYRRLFDFWLKIFGISFGMGVVSGIVMAFQFGTNWSTLAAKGGAIQGPLLGYEAFTAFILEATFLGVVFFARNRIPPWAYFAACCMVALGTTFSAFWIMVNNSWMQVPLGYQEVGGRFVPVDWLEIVLSGVGMIRLAHMMIGAYLTTAFCVAATGAWYALRHIHGAEARVMLRMALALAAILVPAQIYVGDLNGKYTRAHQLSKFTAIEGRWQTEQPARLLLFACPTRRPSAIASRSQSLIWAAISPTAASPPRSRESRPSRARTGRPSGSPSSPSGSWSAWGSSCWRSRGVGSSCGGGGGSTGRARSCGRPSSPSRPGSSRSSRAGTWPKLAGSPGPSLASCGRPTRSRPG